MALEDEFGDIVAKARLGTGVSAAQLADSAGLSEHDIGEIEAYRLTPDDGTVARLADALGLDTDKLAAIAHESWLPLPVDTSRNGVIVRAVHAPFGAYGENSYVAGCVASREEAVIDPGGAVDEIERHLLTNKLDLSMILITHAHADHTGGLHDLARIYPDAKVMCSPLDREAVMHGLNSEWLPAEDGSNVALGKLTVTPLSTPGHTAGSTCYAINGACFVGDTLFAGSIGRPARDYTKMLESIRTKVLSLPDDTVLLPGHGPMTTVGEEKRRNPFF